MTAALPCPHCDAPLADAGAERCGACGGMLVCAGFRIQTLVAHRESGRVYEAVRDSDGRRAAIKVRVMPQGVTWDGWEHVASGMQVLEALEHPGVPRFYGFETDGQGRILIVREYFEGASLEERVRAGERPFDAELFFASLLRVMAYLHDQSPAVLHRDIKPSNILFRTRSPDDWVPVLVDFDTGMTFSESPATPEYAAPETLAGNATLTSDLYSMGLTVIFALTGIPPSELEVRGGRFWLVGVLTGIDPELRRILTRLIDPNRWARYQHADAALQDLTQQPSTLDSPIIDLDTPPHVGIPRLRRNPLVRVPIGKARQERRRPAVQRRRKVRVVSLIIILAAIVAATLIVLL